MKQLTVDDAYDEACCYFGRWSMKWRDRRVKNVPCVKVHEYPDKL